MIKQLNQTECLEVLKDNYIGHLGFISGKSPYILPVTYFYNAAENCIISYSAMGNKIDAMRKYNHVAFQVEEIKSIQNWRSVLIHGDFEELEGSTAKKELHTFAEGVQDTISRIRGEKPKFIKDFSSRLQKETPPIVYRIHIGEINGKFRENS
jgi:nitroimidazol reductase NimA-like FMN-containing flavoprotein (pyridoxamine 5'-phosphate oxidase superfamily)